MSSSHFLEDPKAFTPFPTSLDYWQLLSHNTEHHRHVQRGGGRGGQTGPSVPCRVRREVQIWPCRFHYFASSMWELVRLTWQRRAPKMFTVLYNCVGYQLRKACISCVCRCNCSEVRKWKFTSVFFFILGIETGTKGSYGYGGGWGCQAAVPPLIQEWGAYIPT